MRRPTTGHPALTVALLVVLTLPWTRLPAARTRRDRGDVPGWVLITVMTAGLVSALWIFAGPALIDMLRTALASVTGG